MAMSSRSASTVLPPLPRCLLCDAGNTLVFLDCAAVSDVLRQRAVVVAPAALAAAQGPAARAYERAVVGAGVTHEAGWRLYMTALLQAAGVAGDTGALVGALRAAHDALNLWRQVPPGLAEALERLRAVRPAVRLGVVSNSEGQLANLLAHVGLARFFDVIIDSGVVGVAKPERRIFELALEPLGVGAGDAVYVGDLPHVDVVGARSAGLGAVLVDPTHRYDGADDLVPVDVPRVPSVASLIEWWLAVL